MYADLKFLDGLDGGSNQTRFDALPTSLFMEQQLLQIDTRLFERKYPELTARRHIPIDTNISAGAKSWAFQTMDHRGRPEFFGGNATNIPRVGVAKGITPFPVAPFWLAYGWTILDIQHARFANVPLETTEADACRRLMAEFENEKLITGDATLGIPGFLNNPAVPIVVPPTGGWLAAGVTAAQLIDDANYIIDRPWLGTSTVHRATNVLLPPAHMRKLQTTQLTGTGQTVMQFIQAANPGVTFDMMLELATASAAGGPRAVAYQKDPDMLIGVVPQPFTPLEPQRIGIEILVPTWQTIGGVAFRYPRSAVYADGI